MIRSVGRYPSYNSLKLLSQMLMYPLRPDSLASFSHEGTALKQVLLDLEREDFDDLIRLAHSHHVVVRWLELVLGIMREEQNAALIEWAEGILTAERLRVATATQFLRDICTAFHEQSHNVMVIKSLDHWPDIGSDLDLYTDANSESVLRLMREGFKALVGPRSWGDRLADKWNFFIPDLPEAIEVHVGRLGQTGEQLMLASSLAGRARQLRFGTFIFRVPSTADRLMISSLQRIYRHFNFRLCDILDTAALANSGAIDYDQLRSLASAAGIWEGVATHLLIVSDYTRSYRGFGLDLPSFVLGAARFGGGQVSYSRGYLRIPIMPQSASLYRSQLAHLLGRGELQNGARLSLLPWLATAAVAKQAFTGSDKGIW